MMAAVTALILICFGTDCQVLDGYPMDFDDRSFCLEHLNEVAATVVAAEDPEASVIMVCSDVLDVYEGTLP